jgi:hypothetical protein
MVSEKQNKVSTYPQNGEAEFYQSIAELLIQARQHAKRQVDNVMLVTYYEVGRRIVEHEQKGKKRASYGKHVLAGLADYLSVAEGKAFSVDNLKLMRRFYHYSAS